MACLPRPAESQGCGRARSAEAWRAALCAAQWSAARRFSGLRDGVLRIDRGTTTHPKADVVVAAVGRVDAAVGSAAVTRKVVPGPAARRTGLAVFTSRGITCLIQAPFPGAAACCQVRPPSPTPASRKSPTAVVRPMPDSNEFPPRSSQSGPQENANHAPPRPPLPSHSVGRRTTSPLRAQAGGQPAAEGHCVVPRHIDHRVIGEIPLHSAGLLLMLQSPHRVGL